MQINRSPLVSFLGMVFFLALAGQAIGQTDKHIDSLKNKLRQFDAGKSIKEINNPQLKDTVKVQILDALVSAHYKNDPNGAFAYSTEELSLSEKLGYQWGIANACNSLGVIYDQKSDYLQALKYYEKSLKIRKATGSRIGEEDSYYNIGVLYGKQANYSEALKNMLKGLAIARQIKDSFGIAGGYNNIGVLYMAQKNYPEALKNYFGCLRIFQQMQNTSAMGVIYQNIGEIHLLQNKPDQAISYLSTGLKMAEESGDKEAKANNYHTIGQVYQKKKQYDTALENFLAALKIRQEIGDGYGIADSYITIGNAYFKKGDSPKAILNIGKGLALVKKSGELDLMKDGYQYLSEIYNATRNYKLAYQNHILYKEITDSIFNSEKEKKFVQLQLKYDFKSIQDSIKATQAKKDVLAQAEVKDQRNRRNFIFVVMSLIVVFLIILLWQRNKIAIVRRQKALERERNRISRDLHDNLGAQLSAVRMFMVSLMDSKSKDVPEIAVSSISLLDASINDLRNVMDEMENSVLIEKGYLAATEVLINKVNKLNNIKFLLTHHKMEERPAARAEHQLYRITQELVNNTLKYSKAKNVSIDLLRSDKALVLMYEDDGIGYDIRTVKRGYGLRNIETRVKSLGGKVEFDSMPNAGARTIIEIPQ